MEFFIYSIFLPLFINFLPFHTLFLISFHNNSIHRLVPWLDWFSGRGKFAFLHFSFVFMLYPQTFYSLHQQQRKFDHHRHWKPPWLIMLYEPNMYAGCVYMVGVGIFCSVFFSLYAANYVFINISPFFISTSIPFVRLRMRTIRIRIQLSSFSTPSTLCRHFLLSF